MEIPETRRRLNEAGLALLDLQNATRDAVWRAEALRPALNAFLTAARSVTFVLRKEAPAAYEAWARQWWEDLPPEEGQLCNLTNLCGACAHATAKQNECTCNSKRRAKHKATSISKLVGIIGFWKSRHGRNVCQQSARICSRKDLF